MGTSGISSFWDPSGHRVGTVSHRHHPTLTGGRRCPQMTTGRSIGPRPPRSCRSRSKRPGRPGRGRDPDRRGPVPAGRHPARAGPQPAGPAGRPVGPRRDRRLPQRRPSARLLGLRHGDDALALLVLQRARPPVRDRRGGDGRVRELLGRSRVAGRARCGGGRPRRRRVHRVCSATSSRPITTSGSRTSASTIWLTPSSSVPTRCSWTRCATSWGSTSTRPTAPWSSAWTRRPRSKRSIEPPRCSRFAQGSPSGAPMTTCATGPPTSMPPSTWPPGR